MTSEYFFYFIMNSGNQKDFQTLCVWISDMDTVPPTGNDGQMLMITNTKSRIKGQRHLKKPSTVDMRKTTVWA
jgi:hypothetical protein